MLTKKSLFIGCLFGISTLYGQEATVTQKTTSGVAYATQPQVVAVDEYGNIDTDYTGSVTLTQTGNGALVGTVTQSAVAGSVNYSNIAYKAIADNESYTLKANDGTLAEGTSSSVISDVVATKLVFDTQPAPTALERNVAMDFTTDPVVKAVDADGLVDTDFAELVTLSENGIGAGTFTNNTATALAGVATFTGLTLSHDTKESFTLSADDVDGTGSNLPTVESTTLSVNSSPVNTLPTTPTIHENSSNTAIAGISISDFDGETQTVVLTVTNGTISLNGIAGLTFTTGDGTNDASMTFSGTVADINTALNNLTFTPTANFRATATLQLQTTDGTSTSDNTLNIDVVDGLAPSTTSFTRQTPTAKLTNASTLVLRAIFSETVTGVDASDFTITGTTATVTHVNPIDGTTYDVTISGGDLATYNGAVGLNLKAGQNIKDSAGNALPTTEPTTDETYTVDTTLPATPTMNPTNGKTITGTGEAGATVTVKDSYGNTIGTAIVGAEGTWTITLNESLANGVALTATQTDRAGNSAATASSSTTVDKDAPAVPVMNPSNGSIITGTGEIGATVTVKDNNGNTIGTTTVGADGTWTINPTSPLANGVALTSTQTDGAGNSSTASESSSVDTTNADATLTESATVVEPVKLPSSANTVEKAVSLFDFTLTDGGTSDGFSTDISQIVLHTEGSTADFSKVTWRLSGANVSNIAGTYNATANTLTFSGLSISIADNTSKTYTVNGYFSNPRGLTENDTYKLSIDGDDDVTVDEEKTKMSGFNSAVTNGSGTAIDIVATKLHFMVLPSN